MVLLVGILASWNKLVVKVQVNMAAAFINPILCIIRKSKVFSFSAMLKL